MAARTSTSFVVGLTMLVASATLLGGSPASADELASTTLELSTVRATPQLVARINTGLVPAPPVGQSRGQTMQPIVPERPAVFRRTRPLVLIPLYAAVATLNVLDAHSTFRALDAGARESNPLMAPFAGNKGAMLAVKAGVTASTIMLSERMWRDGKRKTAVAMLAALSVANALIVRHNYRVGSSLR